MQDEINDFDFFITLASSKSMTRASIELDIPLPTISRKLAKLETLYDKRLINRSARQFELTESGKLLLDRSIYISSLMKQLHDEVSQNQNTFAGKLRIGSLNYLGRSKLGDLVAQFNLLHPNLEIELILSDSKMDLVEDELDILFQLEQPNHVIYDSEILLDTQRVFCASPEYFEKHGYLHHPLDLLNHRCICLIRNRHIYQDWKYTINDEIFEVRVHPFLKSNNAEVTHQWMIQGYGIGYRLYHEIKQELEKGMLIECFENYHSSQLSLYMVYSKLKKRDVLKGFISYVKENIGY
ncbi:LysR family transcriptional regulator [Acinetobacter sichuanensis]|uniref:LysR family transcriptional regulator n=1 Tax=Acinetobacter sichuanensis TaxID=2136183 RepID=A0A371YNJ9_9GAMM|nr:LysR family transcriptional regulator [Acinetobacter sichuanensis]RFC83036.1 LysR family transcriptional regulator [Acinetobacter sichuanensis]